jgi:DNA modification methylase
VAFALQADGWYLRSEIIWAKPNPMPESVTDRPTKAHEQVFLLAKSQRYYYDAAAIAEPSTGLTGGRFGAGGPEVGRLRQDAARPRPADDGTRNRRTVWTVPTQPFSGAHFAVMPEALVEPCVLAGSARGDLVLDPFAGSGTVGVVALRHGRRVIGCELNAEYARMAQRRISGPLFADVN